MHCYGERGITTTTALANVAMVYTTNLKSVAKAGPTPPTLNPWRGWNKEGGEKSCYISGQQLDIMVIHDLKRVATYSIFNDVVATFSLFGTGTVAGAIHCMHDLSAVATL